ncbi:MAG: hypothetical protein NT052_02090 [Candidatus Shapirobacteria bacterium]|nr:hypothetical protein [Candidatus Shapirobacteria bacterium]
MAKIVKKKKKRPWLILILILIFLGFLIFSILKIYHSCNNSLWDGEHQFNIIVNSQPASLISFNSSEETISVLLVPNGTFIETTHGYGPYRIESIYRLGELKGNGVELLTSSLQNYFGLPVDGFLQGNIYQIKSSGIKNSLLNQFFEALRHDKKTNLSRWDLLRLWWQIKKTREDKINLIDLSQTSASQEVDLPDGSKAMKIETERLVRIFNQFFIDGEIRQEGLTIGVLNKTDKAGLANSAAKIITNIGGRVINIGIQNDVSKEKNNCGLKSSKKYKNSYTVHRLNKIFHCYWQGELEDDNQRSDIVILLGEDY